QGQAARDRVGHAAARLAHRRREVDEEGHVEGRAPPKDEEAENQHERQEDDEGRQGREDVHHRVGGAADGDTAHSRTSFTAPPTLHTRSRASAFTATVTTKSRSPISMSAAR